ncbi:MAG: LacI family DNA-binding transcriptional regulator [Ktedonobacteraceae bacterium]
MAATLRDVAQRAGVSIKTVSNVVHDYEHVTDEVRERVQQALKELRYQPNLPARYLRTGRVGVLAFAIPNLSNPYFSDVGTAIIAAAAARSYTVLIDCTGGERDNELRVLDGLRPHLIDGVILSPLALEPGDLQARQGQAPLVLLGEHLLDTDVPYDHIANSNVEAARLATSHLLALGRRRIAAIGNLGTIAIMGGTGGQRRLCGYSEALAQAGLSVDPQLIVQVTSYSRLAGVHAMQQLLALDQPPDAVFCFNDLLALGAMRTLHEGGYRIPEDVAVMGFDDIEEASFAMPSLSTVVPDKQRMGELAVSFLLERIEGTRTGPAERVEVPFHLMVRESTGKVT